MQQRIRWWSALSLLRSLASSPAAAAETLNNRADTLDADTPADADAIGAATLYDQADDQPLDTADAVPGVVPAEEDTPTGRERRTLQGFRERALAITPDEDTKLHELTTTVRTLLAESFHPIVFCRFIPTAHYVTAHLRQHLPDATVEVVTGELPPEERSERVRELARDAAGKAKVLVATDCLDARSLTPCDLRPPCDVRH